MHVGEPFRSDVRFSAPWAIGRATSSRVLSEQKSKLAIPNANSLYATYPKQKNTPGPHCLPLLARKRTPTPSPPPQTHMSRIAIAPPRVRKVPTTMARGPPPFRPVAPHIATQMLLQPEIKIMMLVGLGTDAFGKAHEDFYQTGVALDRHNATLQQAHGHFVEAAELGSAEALYNVGYMLAHGLGVPKNLSQALMTLERAAVLGNPMAMDMAARILFLAEERSADDVERAFHHWEGAVSQNHALAQFHFGAALIDDTTPSHLRNPERGLLLMTAAANQGDANALAFLAAYEKVEPRGEDGAS